MSGRGLLIPRTESCGDITLTGTIGTLMLGRGATVGALVEEPTGCSSIALALIPVETRVDLIFIPKLVFLSSLFVLRGRSTALLLLWRVGAIVCEMTFVVAHIAFWGWKTLVFCEVCVGKLGILDTPDGCPLGRGYLALSGQSTPEIDVIGVNS